jgi:hypothetical protein
MMLQIFLRGIRNYVLFSVGMADTFEGYVMDEGRPCYPRPAGYTAHLIITSLVIVCGWFLAISYVPLSGSRLQEFGGFVGLMGMTALVTWIYGMSRFNWWNFKRRHPGKVKNNGYYDEMIAT